MAISRCGLVGQWLHMRLTGGRVPRTPVFSGSVQRVLGLRGEDADEIGRCSPKDTITARGFSSSARSTAPVSIASAIT